MNEAYNKGDFLRDDESGTVFEVRMTNEENEMTIISTTGISMIVPRNNPEGFTRFSMENEPEDNDFLDNVSLDASPDFIKFSIFMSMFKAKDEDVNKAIAATNAVIEGVFKELPFK